jgi:hypothetical protein
MSSIFIIKKYSGVIADILMNWTSRQNLSDFTNTCVSSNATGRHFEFVMSYSDSGLVENILAQKSRFLCIVLSQEYALLVQYSLSVNYSLGSIITFIFVRITKLMEANKKL